MKEHPPETASQTMGPYVHIGLASDVTGFRILKKNFGPVPTTAGTTGKRTTIEGRVIDGPGTSVCDMLLEIRQANAAGRYNHPDDRQQQKAIDPGFRDWGCTCSDFTSGVWRFDTIKPGLVAGRDGRPVMPHVDLWMVIRGVNIGLNTRMYFADEHGVNVSDSVLNLIEWEVRRKTLIAERGVCGSEVVYRFDVYLQGENETVFFDIQRPRRQASSPRPVRGRRFKP